MHMKNARKYHKTKTYGDIYIFRAQNEKNNIAEKIVF